MASTNNDYQVEQTDQPVRSRRSATRPRRPLGLLLTYITIILIYGVGPLLRPAMVALFNASGSKMSGATSLNGLEWLNMVIGITVIILSILAWIGKPRWSRMALLVLIWVATIMLFVLTLIQAQQGSTSGSSTGTSMICQTGLFIVIPAYLTWYINRPAARAYYDYR